MTQPSVAVVIPTLDRPDALRRCLDAIDAGTRHPDRILVCDQSTGPDSQAVVAGRPGVFYLHLPAPSASTARQAGLQRAETSLVAFVDDDCVPAPGWIEGLIGAYRRESRHHPVAAVSGAILPLPGSRGVPVSARAGRTPRVFDGADGGLEAARWAPWDAGSGGNLLVVRQCALAVGGWDPALGPGSAARAGEDVDLLYRLARAGRLVFTPDAVVYHAAATRQDRLRRRYGYGRGMGTMLAKHVSAGEPAARPLAGLYVRHQLASAARTLWGPLESLLVLSGFARGFAPAVRAAGRGTR